MYRIRQRKLRTCLLRTKPSERHPGRAINFITALLFGSLLFSLSTSQSRAQVPQTSRLIDLSLEELGNINITSVSKKEQRLADTPASIYVITGDAARRSGMRRLPDILRLAPNLQVAQITANSFAITMRGFNSSSANKLLVMKDGRTIYTPLYSGVFWDVQDVMLENIDRIEVISGPGGTLWGANAVNGIINIITKETDVKDVDFARAEVDGVGHNMVIQHHGTLGKNGGSYRVYGKTEQGSPSSRTDGSSAQDSWGRSQTGFRVDLTNLTIQGDAYRGVAELLIPQRQINTGANLLMRWTEAHDDGAEIRVQSYLDYTKRIIPALFTESMQTLDLDIQYATPAGGTTQTIWGGGYRYTADQVGNSDQLAFLPAQRNLRWANLFIQHEKQLRPDLSLTVGTKLESNIYTGLEFLPSIKITRKLQNDRLLWAGLARSVRAPSRLDVDFFVPGKSPYLLAGGPNFQSELANTMELGWRQQAQRWSYSLTLSHSEFMRLRSVKPLPDGVLVLANQIHGNVNALEAWGSYQATPTLAFDIGGVILREHFCGRNLSRSSQGNDPRAQWTLGGRWNIHDNQYLTINVRHVDSLPAPFIPAYTSVDANFNWQLSKRAELSLSGRNLFNPHHQEFASTASNLVKNPILLERSVGIKLTVRF
ncbi:MAG: TonB-dependent receptor [Burkholderiales bacterium]|nr:TonB-dependent receptor [Burkholderiales bacterium]